MESSDRTSLPPASASEREYVKTTNPNPMSDLRIDLLIDPQIL